jgi:hypothetical protein
MKPQKKPKGGGVRTGGLADDRRGKRNPAAAPVNSSAGWKCKECRHFTIIDNGAQGIKWCKKFHGEFNRNQPGCLEYEEKEERA